MKVSLLPLLLAATPSTVVSFVLAPTEKVISYRCWMCADDGDKCSAIVGDAIRSRREILKSSSLIFGAFMLGSEPRPSLAAEEKIYSSNAKNMARLGSGDSSGGSIYDNNPSSPKARARRAMVGCKNSSARSLAGDNIGKKLSEKECNQVVMSGNADFMLDALTELDCPTCPYGIGTR